MGLNNKLCEHPFAYCKSKRVFLSREDVRHKKCYAKETFDMIGTCKCKNLVERRAILKIHDYPTCYGYLKNIQNKGGISEEEFDEIWNYIEVLKTKLYAAESRSNELHVLNSRVKNIEAKCKHIHSELDDFLRKEREEQNNGKENNRVSNAATKGARNRKHKHRRKRDEH